MHCLREECTPAIVDIIEYINLDSTGNAIDFGNLLEALEYTSGLASRTRGVLVVEILIQHMSIEYSL